VKTFDVIIIGAGAAGMMCAAQAGLHGLSVCLIDHAQKLGEKIRISGGGRCNFTNSGATWENYVSQNPRFARYALTDYTPDDFLALLAEYKVAWHEKHKGQLFCNDSSQQIIDVLYNECVRAKVCWQMPCTVNAIDKQENHFLIQTNKGDFQSRTLVIATGGMAAPPIGATDFGLKIARQFGHKIIEPRPALVPLVFDGEYWQAYSHLAGVSLEACLSTGLDKKATRFVEDILFTHKGLSGPGVLQISSYWDGSSPLYIDLLPQIDIENILLTNKAGSKQQLQTLLSDYLPKRLVLHILHMLGISEQQKWAEVPDKLLRQVATYIKQWQITPKGTAGYKKAEAMRGGVCVDELDQKTMQSKKTSGLYFIGEVMDITGWLGGYNFQWAWSSAYVCAKSLSNSFTK